MGPLLLIWLVAVAPGAALAQQADDTGSDDPTTMSDEELYAEDQDLSGIEERVVLAGESEAAAAFESSDSVTGFNAADLEAVGAFNVADLAKFTPNLEIVTAGSTSPTFFIRGIGLNDFNPNSTGAISIYQNDVPINAPALQLGMLFDVEQVNILRGPQGTGPARNASGGAIKIYARRPKGNYNAFVKSSYGRFNAVDVEGAFEAPIVEDIIASRFAFRVLDRDGFAKNGCGNAPAYDSRPILRRSDPAGTEALYSICGEDILPEGTLVRLPDNTLGIADGRSQIPEGLPRDVNDQGNWAARGSFLIEPTLDMEFLLIAQGGRRDELSRLGQSAGTSGIFCPPDIDISLCFTGPAADRPIVRGLLGGGDRAGYVEPDVREFFNATQAQNLAKCFPCTIPERDEAINLAKITTARNVAEELDQRPFRGDYDRVGKTTNDTYGVSLKGDMALPAELRLVTVTGFDGYNRTTDVDLDFSPNILFEIFTEDEGWQVAHSMALSGQVEPIAESPIDWELGVFGLIEHLDVQVQNDFGDLAVFQVAGRDYQQDTQSAAGYFSFSWDFWEDFTLDGGARYNYDRKKIDYVLDRAASQLTDKQTLDWSAPTGTVRLTYRFREDTHAYWKYTRGWKGGHFNATSSLFDGVTSAEPETIDAFEVGVRGSWFNGRLGADAQLFWYNYDDYQLFTVQQQLGSQPEFVVLNASDARVFGSEIQASARPWTGAFLEARFAWLESQFLDFVQIQRTRRQLGLTSVIVQRELDNSGNRLLNSPRFKFSLTAEQTVPLARYGSLTARYDGAWTDDTFFDATEGRGIPNADNINFLPGNTVGQKAYWIHNLRLGYLTPDGNIELSGWVRNLTNKAYKTFSFDGSTFQQTTIHFVGDPRTYGVTLTVNFF